MGAEKSSHKSWEQGPWKLISFIENGAQGPNPQAGIQPLITDMVLIHNAIIRGINAIYLQCLQLDGAPAADVADFCNFCKIWGQLLEEHHDAEERLVFPRIDAMVADPKFMDPSVDQHHAFLDGLHDFVAYADAVQAGKAEYSGEKLKGIVDGFMPVLYQHLTDEIVQLNECRRFDEEDNGKLWKEASKDIMAEAKADVGKQKIVLPFILCCTDNTFEPGSVNFPPVPYVIKLVIRYFIIPQKKNWWRFGPCDANGRPQELPYVK